MKRFSISLEITEKEIIKATMGYHYRSTRKDKFKMLTMPRDDIVNICQNLVDKVLEQQKLPCTPGVSVN